MRFPMQTFGVDPALLPADDAGAASAVPVSPRAGGPPAGAGAGDGAGGAGGGGGGGGGGPDNLGGSAAAPVFAETLPADIRGDAAFRDIKDLGGLAKSYLHASKLIGRDPKSVLALPGADDQKAWGEVYDRLGRPPAPDKYQLKAPTLPEGMSVNETLQKNFVAKAWELGFTDKQVGALYDWWNGQGVDAHKSRNRARGPRPRHQCRDAQKRIRRGLRSEDRFGASRAGALRR